MTDTPLIIAGQTYNSRLLVGSGKYQDLTEKIAKMCMFVSQCLTPLSTTFQI
jgi:thiazole synthase